MRQRGDVVDVTEEHHARMQKRIGQPIHRTALDGAFFVDGRIFVMASTGHGWEHVSVSLETRCPTWQEMDEIKRIFFLPHEAAIQIRPPEEDHVDCHPYCLHLWAPVKGKMRLPPKSLVGGA